MFLRIFKHLLPRARAWRLTVDKTLRQFFEGLAGLPSDIRDFIDQIWLDIFPATTRQITEWEQQFGVLNPPTLEADRRDNLLAQWQRGGGQGPDTLEAVLRDAGFDVYVHEPWYYAFDYTPAITFGEASCQMGEPDFVFGDTSLQKKIRNPNDYIPATASLLVNKILIKDLDYLPAVTFGEVECAFGEPDFEFGNNAGFTTKQRVYTIPNSHIYWAYFWYIGGINFGDIANVPADRKDEFETLVLKIGPAHVWAGLFINYV